MKKFFFTQIKILAAIFILFSVASVFYETLVIKKELTEKAKIGQNRNLPVTSYSPENRDNLVLGENTEVEFPDSPANLVIASENFQLKGLFVGDEVSVESGDNKNDPISIFDIKNELISAKNSQEIKMLVSWKTNKPTMDFLEYSKEGEAKPNNITEEAEATLHTAIIPKLAPSSVYTYTISSKDQWGNQASSDKFAVYTGAPNVSLVDILEDAVKKSFGWAMKK